MGTDGEGADFVMSMLLLKKRRDLPCQVLIYSLFRCFVDQEPSVVHDQGTRGNVAAGEQAVVKGGVSDVGVPMTTNCTSTLLSYDTGFVCCITPL